MNKYEKSIFIIIFLLFLFGGFGLYKNINKSYGYFSNVDIARTILANVSGAYYDRGSYIQYDDSYINNNIKRSNGYYYPEDINKNNIVYMDNVSFISNIFNIGFDYDIKDIFGNVSLNSIYEYGETIYNNAVLNNDIRVNYQEDDNIIDYYDNIITTTSASIGETDFHILTMYVNNSDDIDKEYIYNKLVNTLYIGDIIVYDDNVLLYVGNNRYIYCSGNSYDYDNKIDNKENRAIKYGDIDDLNNNNSDKYIFNSDKFYVYRIFNRYGTWKLTKYHNSMKDYYSNDIIPKIKIERYDDIGNSYIYNNKEINYTIRIYNNTNDVITVPSIRNNLNSGVEYISNNYSESSYSNGVLLFNNIEIDGNSYRDIEYSVKVISEEKNIKVNNIYIGNYQLGEKEYKIGKSINLKKIINSYNKYDNAKELYNSLFDIDINIDNIWDNILDNDNYKDGYELLIDGLYGGININTSNEYVNTRTKYIDKNMLVTGDLIFYNDSYVMYLEDDNSSYLYDYNSKNIINNVDSFLDSLFGMNRFMVIRPSYKYSKNNIEFGNLNVDYDNNIIKIKERCIFSNIIDEISGYDDISIKDKDNNDIDNSEYVKTGDRILIDSDIYYISLLGDASGDGKINYLDYVNIYNHIQKIKHPGSNKKLLVNEYLVAADMSEDGKINYLDYVKIYNKIKELKGGTN